MWLLIWVILLSYSNVKLDAVIENRTSHLAIENAKSKKDVLMMFWNKNENFCRLLKEIVKVPPRCYSTNVRLFTYWNDKKLFSHELKTLNYDGLWENKISRMKFDAWLDKIDWLYRLISTDMIIWLVHHNP